MLVLSRKVGQALLFGDEIEVTVLRVDGEQVRLGINAPKRITILRKELLEAVRSEMSEARTNSEKQGAAAADLRQLSQRLKKSPQAPTAPTVPPPGGPQA